MIEPLDLNGPLTGGTVVLEASAGTGKTFALAHLTLRLISEAAMPLPSLLVVTFTDAAAAELRSRIGQRLQDALAGLEALARGDALPEADPVLQQWWQQAPQAAGGQFAGKANCRPIFGTWNLQ